MKTSPGNICRMTFSSGRTWPLFWVLQRVIFEWKVSARRAGIRQRCTARRFRLAAVVGQSSGKFPVFGGFFRAARTETGKKSVRRLTGAPAVHLDIFVSQIVNSVLIFQQQKETFYTPHCFKFIFLLHSFSAPNTKAKKQQVFI